jgi:hypothetical protein
MAGVDFWRDGHITKYEAVFNGMAFVSEANDTCIYWFRDLGKASTQESLLSGEGLIPRDMGALETLAFVE